MSHEPASDLSAVIAAMDQSPVLLSFYEGEPLVVTAQNNRAGDVFGPILGLRPEQAFGATPLEEIGRRLSDVASSGEPFSAASLPFEVKGPDGESDEIFLDIVAQPWLRPDGSVRGVSTVAVDVTKSVAARRAQAAQVAELRRERSAAQDTLTALQDSLLPSGLPVLPGARIAAEYLMAENASGGDWFDAIGLDDGRVVVAVGDVVGSGVGATVVMGELRAVFDETVRRDGDILAALEVIDQRALRITQARATTVCAAVVEPQTGLVTYATAGHPPPLAVDAEQGVTYLPATGDPALGSGRRFRAVEHRLAEGEMLILYSNGLVRRPGLPMRDSAEVVRMVKAVHQHQAAVPEAGLPLVERVCSGLVEAAGQEGIVDDISVLVIERVTPIPALSLSMSVDADVPREMRHRLVAWLKPLGVSGIDVTALQHSVGELVSNAVEHAYTADDPPAHRTVGLDACLSGGGVLEIAVTDRGRWRSDDPHPDRGRGLAMVQGFCDEVEIERRPNGTQVRLRHRPRRAAQLLSGPAAPDVEAPLMFQRAEGELAIGGPVDRRSADRLRHELATLTRGGTVPLLLDLSKVTVLASVGVQVLFERMETSPGLRLFAPEGSAAQRVLELVCLPHDTSREPISTG